MNNINWYPGHMKKTKELIQENLKMVDFVIEILDARVPLSSKNPDIENWCKNKTRIVLLNKMDLVPNVDIYKKYFIDVLKVDYFLPISVEKGTNIGELKKYIKDIYNKKLEKMKKKGLIKTNIRAMVIGIPNVGKSKFINKMSSKNKAKVGNLPGFTRGKQWIRVDDTFELLDTPGILWPKFEDENVSLNLAVTGSIKDDILPIEEVANRFLYKLRKYDILDNLITAYNLEEKSLYDYDNLEIFDKIIKRLEMQKISEYNYENISKRILRDYRTGKIGKFFLEYPDESWENEKI